MSRLQATIDEQTKNILDSLFRRNDTGRFIELAVKSAYNNPEIKQLFSWKENNPINNYNMIKVPKQSTKNKSEINESKAIFDEEFN